MTGTSGGHYERPNIGCKKCGRTGGRFSRVKDGWLCDECLEFDDMLSGDFVFPKIDCPRESFNKPRFVWGEPSGKEKIA